MKLIHPHPFLLYEQQNISLNIKLTIRKFPNDFFDISDHGKYH